MSTEVQKFTQELLEKKRKELEAVELEIIAQYEPESDDDEEKPDMVLAFHEDIGLGRGTKDMVKRALVAGLTVRVILKR